MTFVAIQSTALTVVLLVATMATALVPGYAKLQRFERSPKPDGSLSLLVVGDWGRNGLFNQSEVATQVDLSPSFLLFDLCKVFSAQKISKKDASCFLFCFGREEIEHKDLLFSHSCGILQLCN